MGAHMILKKNLWERVGGWDEALGGGAVFPGAEDFDFSYRAQRLGAVVMALPELTLVHRTGRPKSFYFEKHLFDYGLGEAAFCIKHARCGDRWALKRLLRVLVLYSARAVWRSLRRRPDATGFLRGLLAGLARAPRVAIDSERRVYTP
jgi:GT2 family glycosyltransferase